MELIDWPLRESASVFVNEVAGNGSGGGTQKRRFRSVAVQRSYLDGDERKWTSSFGLNDLPDVICVLQLAQQEVEEKEAIVTD